MRVRNPVGVLPGLAVAAVAALLGFDAGAQDEWTTFTSEEGRFSVLVPDEPVKSELRQHSFVGTVVDHIFTSEASDASYTVDYSDIPHFALDFAGPDTIYEHAKGALLKKTFGKPTSYTDASVSGAAGKRLVYDTPPAPGRPKMRGDAVLVLVGSRLYVIDVVSPESVAEARAERFLSSVDLLR